MTIKELYQKLNELSDYYKFQIDEVKRKPASVIKEYLTKEKLHFIDEFHVYISYPKYGKDELLTIVAPSDEGLPWFIRTDSPINAYKLDDLNLYIKVLELVKQFIAEKSDDNA